MLDSHPRLTVTNDTHFIPRALAGHPAGSDPQLTDELVERVRTYHRFHRMGLPDTAVDEAAAGASTYAGFVERLYDAVARRQGKALAGEKTPDYVRHIPLLRSLFPWASIVHIVRDGRDVALSTLQWATATKGPGKFALWQEEPVAVCALWWAWQVGTGRRDGPAGPRYHELRYEDLVSRPEPTLRDVAEAVGLTFSKDMLRFHEGRRRDEPGLSPKRAWLPPTSGLRDWRTTMAGGDVELFEALAGDLLGALGYERAFPSPSAPAQERAARCRDWWEGELSRRARRTSPAPPPGRPS